MIETTPRWRDWAVGAHLTGLFNLTNVPLGAPIAALVVYLMRKNDGEYVRGNAASALNFQLMLLILHAIAAVALVGAFVGILLPGLAGPEHLIHPGTPILFFVIVFGFAGLFVLGNLVSVVFSVMAASAANRGEISRYPTITFVR
jgi:uncharacterized Tic20 family protein